MNSSHRPILVIGFGEKSTEGNLTRERIKIEDILDEYARYGYIDILAFSGISFEALIDELYAKNMNKHVFGLYYSTDISDNENLAADYTNETISAYLKKIADLRELRFLVLNGNASEQISNRLIELGVPSVIGISNKLNRFEASDFAEIFFKYVVETNDIELAFEEAELKMLSYWGGRLRFEDKYWDSEISSPISNFQLPWKLFKNYNTKLNEKWSDIMIKKEDKQEVNATNLYISGWSVGIVGVLSIVLGVWMMSKEGAKEINITGSIVVIGIALIFLAGVLLLNTLKSRKQTAFIDE